MPFLFPTIILYVRRSILMSDRLCVGWLQRHIPPISEVAVAVTRRQIEEAGKDWARRAQAQFKSHKRYILRDKVPTARAAHRISDEARTWSDVRVQSFQNWAEQRAADQLAWGRTSGGADPAKRTPHAKKPGKRGRPKKTGLAGVDRVVIAMIDSGDVERYSRRWKELHRRYCRRLPKRVSADALRKRVEAEEKRRAAEEK